MALPTETVAFSSGSVPTRKNSDEFTTYIAQSKISKLHAVRPVVAEIGSIGWLPLVKPVVSERRYAREIQIVYAIRQNTIGIVERSRRTQSKLIIAGIPTINAKCILALQCAQHKRICILPPENSRASAAFSVPELSSNSIRLPAEATPELIPFRAKRKTVVVPAEFVSCKQPR